MALYDLGTHLIIILNLLALHYLNHLSLYLQTLYVGDLEWCRIVVAEHF